MLLTIDLTALAPHQMSEFYSYDRDLATAVVPNLSYTTQDVNEVNITWDMIGGNTKVYFQLVSSEIGHADIIAGDYDDTTLEIDGDEFQTSAGTHNILGGTTTVDDGNEDMGTGNFPNKSITIKAQEVELPIIHFHLSHLISLHITAGATTGLAASGITNSSMTVSWTAPTGGVKTTNGYKFYHGTNSSTFSNANFHSNNNSSVTSKSITSLLPVLPIILEL